MLSLWRFLPVAVALAGCMSAPDLAKPAIVLVDQSPVDGSITVQQVVSPGPGWIALYTDADNESASVVGHAPVKPGLNRWVRVNVDYPALSRVDAATFLYVTLHTDAAGRPAHHRGEIAQILDAAGGENDFSRITPVIRARRAKG
jgi:hypothetical protein